MTHLWVRAESRANEQRVAITPDGVRALMAAGLDVTVEDSPTRIIPTDAYRDTGCRIATQGAWTTAPTDAIILGLKELPENGTALPHQHIMFGHAFKGQFSGQELLRRFAAADGTLLDLEYLLDDQNRRVAAFGYWAGYAGAAVTALALAAQNAGQACAPVTAWPNADTMLNDVKTALGTSSATALIIGAKGRVGTGAADLCNAVGITPTLWDMAETASGGPFPEILDHDLFFNCILARPGTPVFVGPDALTAPRRLRAIGDIACDPDSDYNPVPLYSEASTWADPVLRVQDTPPLDIMSIDNLPSLLPLESSHDFAEQLLPYLLQLGDLETGVWGRARDIYQSHKL